jgi:hypothetical protein
MSVSPKTFEDAMVQSGGVHIRITRAHTGKWDAHVVRSFSGAHSDVVVSALEQETIADAMHVLSTLLLRSFGEEVA